MIDWNRRILIVGFMAALATISYASTEAQSAYAPSDLNAGSHRTTEMATKAVYFGGLHIHTSFSMDAFVAGTKTTPDDAYSNAGDYEAASADFEAAASLGNPLIVSFDLGVLHYRRGELEMALAMFDQYLEVFPNHVVCLEYRARVTRDLGEISRALADFLKVFELQPRPNPGHYISVAFMLESSGASGIDQALMILDDSKLKLGLVPQLQKYAIELELRRGRPDLAIARLDTLKPMLGKSPNWKVQMAELLLLIEDGDKAQQLLQQASEQLESLRTTPARVALKARINDLG